MTRRVVEKLCTKEVCVGCLASAEVTTENLPKNPASSSAKSPGQFQESRTPKAGHIKAGRSDVNFGRI